MLYELARRGIGFERQRQIPVNCKGVRLECAYRVDLLVEGEVVVELKVIDALRPIHTAQVLSYLKLAGCRAGRGRGSPGDRGRGSAASQGMDPDRLDAIDVAMHAGNGAGGDVGRDEA